MNSVKIHADYPGGNIRVIEAGPNFFKLEQELRDTSEWWFYWGFCIENAQDTELILEFVNGGVIGPWGPAVSRDRMTWNWAGSICRINECSFKYRFKMSDDKVYFCFCIPYQFRNYQNFLADYKESKYLEIKTLCISEQGRDVPLLFIGNQEAKKNIILTCRHHACESPGSYVSEGVLGYIFEK